MEARSGAPGRIRTLITWLRRPGTAPSAGAKDNQMQLVYKLKGLDNILDNLKKDFFQGPIPDLLLNKYRIEQMNSYLDLDYIDIAGIRWTECGYFRKSDGIAGGIHTDTPVLDKLIVGINIVHSGTTIMEYWEDDGAMNIIKQQKLIRTFSHLLKKPPDYSYTLEEGSVYLVNASVPHRAIAKGDRHLFTLRSPAVHTMSWSHVVELFKDHLE